MKMFLLPFLLLTAPFAHAQLMLEGSYLGKNIYIQNPFGSDGKSYCTDSVLVNGKKVDFENSSAYEIKLKDMGFNTYDKLWIKIYHKNDCMPKVLQEFYDPKTTFEVTFMNIDPSGILQWTAINEVNKLTYIIEDFRWNKWIKIGEMEGIGGDKENSYSFPITLHSGTNKLRVKQVIGTTRASDPVTYNGPDLKINIKGDKNKIGNMLEFTSTTLFEMFDEGGNIVRKGFSDKIDLEGLKTGKYFLNYDNKTEEIKKFVF
jgi:hypothetical protein